MKAFFLSITCLFSFVLCSCSHHSALVSHQAELKFHSAVFAWYPGGRVERISPGDGVYYQPSIHPEGTNTVFWGNSSGSPRIWKADLRTKKIAALTPGGWGAYHASYSWDGGRIVFAADMTSARGHGRMEDIDPTGVTPLNRSCNIFTMQEDGSGMVQVTRGDYEDQRPALSPDGENIVFVSNRSGRRYRLYVTDSGGKDEPRLLLADTPAYRPWYSQDGRWIYFFSPYGGRDAIFRVPASSGEAEPIPNNVDGTSHGPFIDQSGKSLLVHAQVDGGGWGIYEIPLEGGVPRRLNPPGFDNATHPGRARNGIIVFDSGSQQ